MKKLITQKYAIYCPDCGEELSIYSIFSIHEFALKCNSCGSGFHYDKNKKLLNPSSAADEIHKEISKYDKYHQYYDGIPTSDEFMPRWLRRIFVRKGD